ncbi:DEAD/DEAH box helicase [Leptolyngbya sp. 15MV]|nr:DEAD/DEAH box helicase [Leptolyngbya sp. 15MV]
MPLAFVQRRATILTMPRDRVTPTFDPALPIVQQRAAIEAAITAHQVVVVCGETGSGKTTQLPKFCLGLGRGSRGAIAHTQPRRLAARAVAARISEELGEPLGGLVGVKVRFDDRTGPETRVKLMTDGMLLAELPSDPDLRAYDTIIIDEAHERSLNIDFLLGYIRRLLPRRPDLKIIVTSATIDPARFSEHFGGPAAAPVVEVPGRLFPIETRYRPVDAGDEDPERVEVEAVADAVEEVMGPRGTAGDVLVFLPGEREIRDSAEAIRRRGIDADILPLIIAPSG